MKKSFLVALGCSLTSLSSLAEPVDGTFNFWPPANSSYDFVYECYWQNTCIARDGGVATITPNSFGIVNSIADWRLGGLVFTALNDKAITGNDITLVGDRPFVSSAAANGPLMQVKVKGTGSNTFVYKGNGGIRFDAALSSFGEARIESGTYRVTTVPVASSVGKLSVAGGDFDSYDTTDVAHDLSSTTLSAGRGGGAYTLGSGLALTVKDVACEQGGTLALQPPSGLSALGDTVTVKAMTAPTAQAIGIVDPRIVGREPSSNGSFSYLTYDGTAGFTAFPTASMKTVAEAGANDVAAIVPPENNAAVSVTGGKTVGALLVDKRAKVSLSDTLTVGDGTNPAGVIFRDSIGSGDDFSFGGGTLAFGGSPAVFWGGGSTTSVKSKIAISSAITGTAGLTLAGQTTALDNHCMWSLTAAAGWTGPLYLNGAVLTLSAANQLPAGGDVYVDRKATVYITKDITLSQNFHLCGNGLYGIDSGVDVASAIQMYTGIAPTFNGTLFLDDDATLLFRNWYSGNVPSINGKITGEGKLILNGPRKINVTNLGNDWTGGVKLGSFGEGAPAIYLGRDASLGTGPIALGAGSLTVPTNTVKLTLKDVTASGIVRGTGGASWHSSDCSVDIARANVDFAGTADIASLRVDTDTLFALNSTLGVDKSLAIGKLDWHGGYGGGKFTALAADSVLRLGSDGFDSCVSAGMNDGSGKLAFVKQGAGTVTLSPGVRSTRDYTGGTRIEKGTLKLDGDILSSPSIVYWLDASDDASFEIGANNKVTKWKSKVGDAYFVPGSSTLVPTRTKSVNDLKVVSFGEGGAMSMVGDKSYLHKTVFVAYHVPTVEPMRPEANNRYIPLLKASEGDHTLRFYVPSDATDKKSYWLEANVSSAKFPTTGYMYLDGVKGTGYFSAQASDKVRVLTAIHEYDQMSNGVTPTQFLPALGTQTSSQIFVGDFAEVIVFDRLLTDGERQRVENYLAEKWGNAKPHAAPAALPALLPEGGDVEVEYGATLDLNGASLVIGKLEGYGTVTNSSSVPARLAVTGGRFAGTIAGNVVLDSAGGDFQLNLEKAASLELSAGETRVQPLNLTPPTDHLAYWLDVTDDASITRDASTGKVSSWASCKESVATAFAQATDAYKPVLTANVFGNRPGVYFNCTTDKDGSTLCADAVTVTRTMFLVFKLDPATSATYAGIWGSSGSRFIRSEGNATQIASPGRIQYWMNGGNFRVNGVDKSAEYVTIPADTVLFTVRIDDSHPDDEHIFGSTTMYAFKNKNFLGAAANGQKSVRQYTAELIAYTNRLDDAQMAAVEQYLMDKWSIAGHTPAAVRTQVVNGTGSVSVSGEATLDGDFYLNGPLVVKTQGAKGTASANPFTLTGALTLGPLATLTVDDFTLLNRKKSPHRLVEATGGVTGEFALTNIDGHKRWSLVKDAKGWLVDAIRGLYLIVR